MEPTSSLTQQSLLGAEELFRPENEHLRAALNEEVRGVVDSLIAARKKDNEYRHLPTELQPLADVYCAMLFAAYFVASSEAATDEDRAIRQWFLEKVGRHAAERVCCILEDWRNAWVDRHGTEPPLSRYEIGRDAVRAGLDANAVANEAWPIEIMLEAIDGYLAGIGDKKRLAAMQIEAAKITAGMSGANGKQDMPTEVAHSDDFRSVNWHGAEHTFSSSQAACIRVLWENWERNTPDVGGETLLEASDSTANRVADLFKRHNAWGTMIIPSESKGAYRLQEPEI